MEILDDLPVYVSLFSDVCTKCVHFNQESVFGQRKTCKAFPDGLPAEVWLGETDHKQPIKGDRGIQFEPIKGDRQDALNCGPNSHQCGDRCVPKTKKCRKKSNSQKGTTVSHADPYISGDRAQQILKEQKINSQKGLMVVIDPEIKAKGVKAVIEEAERQIRDLNYEHGIAINPKTGDIILQKSGGQTGITFEDRELNQLKGAIFTHNHPDLGYPPPHPAWQGATLSADDVRIAASYQFAEMRAVGHEISYSMTPDAKGWSKDTYEKEVFPTLMESIQKNQRVLRGDPASTQINLFDLAWKEAASKHGLTYSVDKTRNAEALRKQYGRKKLISGAAKAIAVLGLAAFVVNQESKAAPPALHKRKDALRKQIEKRFTKKRRDAHIAIEKALSSTVKVPVVLHRLDAEFDGGFAGLFSSGNQLYCFDITPDDRLDAVEAEARGINSQHYLIGWRVDSGDLRRDRAKPVCKAGGELCGDVCLPKGHKCQIKLGKKAAAHAGAARTALGVGAIGVGAGAGVVGVKAIAAHRDPVPPALVPFDQNPATQRKLAAVGIGVGGAASILGAYVLNRQVQSDLEKTSVPFTSIRQPPGGIPDAQTLKTYDSLQPGDLIRKSFQSELLGTRQHYAVYVGKDPETGDHMLIDTGEDWKNRDSVPYVRKRGLTWDAGPNDTEYERVPDIELHQQPGTRQFSRQEIVDRANQMVYQRFTYQGFDSNCETFARGMVEGKAYSAQGAKASKLTRLIAATVTDNMLKIRTPKEGFPGADKERVVNLGAIKTSGLSDYARDPFKMTAQQMVDYLERERVMALRRQTYELIPNPYTSNIEKFQRGVAALPPSKAQVFDLTLANARKDDDSPFTIAGLKDPDAYDQMVETIAQQFPAIADSLRVDLYKAYLMVLFGVLNQQNRTDSLRADKKCGSGYTQEGHQCHKEGGSTEEAEKPATTKKPGKSVKLNPALLAAIVAAGGGAAVAAAAKRGAAKKPGLKLPQLGKKPVVPKIQIPSIPIPAIGNQKKPLSNVEKAKRAAAIAAYVGALGLAANSARQMNRPPTQGASTTKPSAKPKWHEVLRVKPDASPQEIKAAYRKLSKQTHPDANPDDPNAKAKFQTVVEAYEQATGQDKNFNSRIAKEKKRRDAIEAAYQEAQQQYTRMDVRYWDLDSPYSDRFDAAVARLDLKCGGGAISQGEKCHVGEAEAIKQSTSKRSPQERPAVAQAPARETLLQKAKRLALTDVRDLVPRKNKQANALQLEEVQRLPAAIQQSLLKGGSLPTAQIAKELGIPEKQLRVIIAKGSFTPANVQYLQGEYKQRVAANQTNQKISPSAAPETQAKAEQGGLPDVRRGRKQAPALKKGLKVGNTSASLHADNHRLSDFKGFESFRDIPVQTVDFKINGSFDAGSVKDPKEGLKAALAVKKQLESHFASLPEGQLVFNRPYTKDGKGASRAKLYQKAGFGAGDEYGRQWAVIKAGKPVPIKPEELHGYLGGKAKRDSNIYRFDADKALKADRSQTLIAKFSTLSDEKFESWLLSQPDAKALATQLLTLYQTDDAVTQKQDASDRFDIACGNGSISPGEVCHVGLGDRVKQAISKGNEREQKVRDLIKQKTKVELPNRKEIAVMGAMAVGGMHGPVGSVVVPTVARAALEAGQRIYDSKTAKLRRDLVEEIEHETTKELAGGIVGTTVGTIASEAAKAALHGIVPGAGFVAGIAAGASSAALSSGHLANAALKLKRKRKDSVVNDKTIAKLKTVIRQDTKLEPAEVLNYVSRKGTTTVRFTSDSVTDKNPGGDLKSYEMQFSGSGCTWRVI